MSFLLDTYILLWYLIEPKKLSDEVLDILRDPDNEIYFSAATIQEIAIKKRLGKNDFDYEPKIVADAAKNTVGFIPLNVTVEHSISYY
ncbi:type II toxin-antitoxin system VapC family toxin [Photorhabdus australis]|uniref:type II toxin-antitoxin system VapC family toxin n=1 Tax=Photorhabdus australis TaxID=286156 RepID=UPI000DA2478A|nr:type II toxin-antitoxin system VapC family toxin [Photorhabdus australis]